MAVLAIQASASPPGDLSFQAAAAGGDEMPNNERQSFWIKNTHASASRQVTFSGQRACSHYELHHLTVTIPALTTIGYGPGATTIGDPDTGKALFETQRFNNLSGRVVATYSDSGADLQVAAALVST
jgi:hypothetical protein